MWIGWGNRFVGDGVKGGWVGMSLLDGSCEDDIRLDSSTRIDLGRSVDASVG